MTKNCKSCKNKNFYGRDFCVQQFPFIAEDFDALTTYELVGKVICYVNDMAEKIQELDDRVKALEEQNEQP